MYAEHVPIIAAAMRSDLRVFKRGVMFALLSARTQFNRVPAQCKELEQRGAEAACLWGWKFDAYAYVEENAIQLQHDVSNAGNVGKGLWSITRIPGMGIVKGAFVLQMLGYPTACLDTRNIQREGRNPRAYRGEGARKNLPSFIRTIDRYIDDTYGRAEYYWDTWCNEVGPDYGMTGEQISKLHMTTIVPSHVIRRLKSSPSGARPFVIPDAELPY
jgi:hypothetical protein